MITVVSGLPRSGTSMMMRMLEAGGIQLLTDGFREKDEDNPYGYYELEKVKQLGEDGDKSWLSTAKGKVVKIISQLLKELPVDFSYKVIFMQRQMPEILASQKQMLIRSGGATDRISDEELAKLFEKHLSNVEFWLSKQPNFDVIFVNYNDIVENPTDSITKINEFLGGNLNIAAMNDVIDKSLHHQRT